MHAPAERLGFGEELSLASGRQAGHGPVVGRRTRWRQALGRGPQILVAQEPLNAFRVTDQCAQLHLAPTRDTAVDGQAECQAPGYRDSLVETDV